MNGALHCSRCGALLSGDVEGALVKLGLAHGPDASCRMTKRELRALASSLEADFQTAIAPTVARLEREAAAALRAAEGPPSAPVGTPRRKT